MFHADTQTLICNNNMFFRILKLEIRLKLEICCETKPPFALYKGSQNVVSKFLFYIYSKIIRYGFVVLQNFNETTTAYITLVTNH